MILLLDTHVVLWWRLNSPRLKAPVRRAISTAEVVWVSAASAWEVAIKQALGRLRLADAFADLVAASHFVELPISFRHAAGAGALPPHHSDPFDRMLISQARVEGASIVTHDRRFAPYDVKVLWV